MRLISRGHRRSRAALRRLRADEPFVFMPNLANCTIGFRSAPDTTIRVIMWLLWARKELYERLGAAVMVA